jgi:hypothetical protein
MYASKDIYPRGTRIRSIEKYISLYGLDNVCGRCTGALISNTCDKCGEGICAKESCGLTFPEKYNTTYVLCMDCIDYVSKDLHLLIDMGKIEPLKEKIKMEKTVQQQQEHKRRESRDSLSSIQEEARS